MILSDLLTDAYRAYRGKTSSVPQAGSTKYTDMLAIANRKQQEWANDSNINWDSLYELYDGGTLSSGTQSYDLDDNFMKLSDYVLLTSPTGSKKYVRVYKPQEVSRHSEGCYVYGANPAQLGFIQPIDSTLAGWKLTVPCYAAPAKLSNANDIIAVDDPNWLVYAVAYELARNDYAKEEQSPNIKAEADALYTNMVAAAQNNSFLQPNGAANNMPQFVSGFEQGYNGTTGWGW